MSQETLLTYLFAASRNATIEQPVAPVQSTKVLHLGGLSTGVRIYFVSA